MVRGARENIKIRTAALQATFSKRSHSVISAVVDACQDVVVGGGGAGAALERIVHSTGVDLQMKAMCV